MRCVEIILFRVIIRRSGDDHEIRVDVGLTAVGRGCQIKLLICKILFNIIILDRRYPVVDHIDFLRNDIYRRDSVVLGKKNGYA